MKSTARLRMLLTVMASLACAGCGGSTPPPVAAPAAPAAAPAASVPAPLPAPVKSPPADATAAAEATPDETESFEPGPDDFEINPDEVVMEIDGKVEEPPPAPVEVVALAPGLDSSTLEIVDPTNADAAVNTTAPANVPQPAALPANEAATKNATKVTKPKSANTKSKDEEKEAPPPTAAGWQLPAGATPVGGTGTDPETGLPLKITVGRDPVEMVLIPPGVFLEGIDGRDPHVGPQHSVLLETPYYIDVVEVTVDSYEAFREFLRKSEGRRMDAPANHDGNPENPAVGIKFLDAKFYAKWTGKELPTEAQWERAARGSQGFNYPWGNGRPIWHQSRHPGQLDPVGTFPSDISPYGVHDMAGNAREWCLDLYTADAYRHDVASGGSTVRNPAGPKSTPGAKLQVVRGSKTDWVVWERAGQSQAEVAPDVGFRCVLNVATAASDDKPTKKGSDKKKKGEAF